MSGGRIASYFALFGAVMGFALGASWFAPLEPLHALIEQQRSKPEQQAAKPKSSNEGPDAELTEYTLWLTIFTGVLALATLGLGIATTGLYFAGERQMSLSRDEFNATHRPKMIVRAFTLLRGPIIPGEEDFDMSFIIQNIGDAPGTIIEVRSAKAILAHGAKISQDWSLPFKEAFDVKLASGEKELFPLNGPLSEGGSNGMAIMLEEQTLYCLGTVTYLDAGKRRRETGFCRRYVDESNRWEPVDGEYEYAY